MLTRRPPTYNVALPATSQAPTLPGLVSSLRPIKRISAQLQDEANLLHRFSYKNKNQHKAASWWKKVIEVDRVMDRTLKEVENLIAQFGASGQEKDDMQNIGVASVVSGLLQLPRSILIVEKSIEVLLKCASILEQLIHSRAFLAFALIIVSLVARLHSLSMVLRDEFYKLSQVLNNLVEVNNLKSIVDPLVSRLPRELRKLISPTSKPLGDNLASEKITPSVESLPATTASNDDTGSVVVRRPATKQTGEKDKIRGSGRNEGIVESLVSSVPSSSVPSPLASTTTSMEVDPPAVPKKLKKKKQKIVEEVTSNPTTSSRTVSPIGLFPFDLDEAASLDKREKKVKRPRVEGAEEGELLKSSKSLKSSKPSKLAADEAGGHVVKKDKKEKKKKAKKDEIDDIFG